MVSPKYPLLLVSHVSNLMKYHNAENLGVSDSCTPPPTSLSVGGIGGHISLLCAACDDAESFLSGRGEVRGVQRETA